MIISFLHGLLIQYLVGIPSALIMDKMKPFFREKLITNVKNMLMEVLKRVKLAIETTSKFVRRKMAAVTEILFVKRMKNITYFFKRKNPPEPICTHMV